MIRIAKLLAISMGVWLVSAAAFSKGSLAPELPILHQAKTFTEYPALRRLQELTLELQLLEITIKNRRDGETEARVAAAMKEIEAGGQALGTRLKELRDTQLEEFFAIFFVARKFSGPLGVVEREWNELLAAVREGQFTSGALTVRGSGGRQLQVLILSPLQVGRQMVWQVSLPADSATSFWSQARKRASRSADVSQLSARDLDERVSRANAPYYEGESAAKAYFAQSYGRLFEAFQSQRYAILQRVSMARKALLELSRQPSAMSVPEQYAILYNRTLENLFSFGLDISLTGIQRDFSMKGFLFADSPEASQALYQRLKFKIEEASYNSPSS